MRFYKPHGKCSVVQPPSLEDKLLRLAPGGRGKARAVVGLLLVPSHPFWGPAASQTYLKMLSRRLRQRRRQSALLTGQRGDCSTEWVPSVAAPQNTTLVQGKDGPGQGLLTARALPAMLLSQLGREESHCKEFLQLYSNSRLK